MGRFSRSRSRSNSGSRSRSPSEEGFRIHVSDLGLNASKIELERQFNKFGSLIEVWLARNPPCFAFVVFKHREDAEDAVRDLDGSTLCGSRVRISFARPRTRGMRRRRGFDPNLRCYQCGERGHFSRDCNQINRRYRQRRSRSASPHRRQNSRYSNSRSRSRSRDRSRSRSRDRKMHSRDKSRSKSRDRKKRSTDRSRSKSRDRSKRSRSKTPLKSKERKNRNESTDSKKGRDNKSRSPSVERKSEDRRSRSRSLSKADKAKSVSPQRNNSHSIEILDD